MAENKKTDLSVISELKMQRMVHSLLSDPAAVRSTVSDKRVQVLSPGRINHSAGPDFLDIAVLINGAIVVGDAEFHRNSSDWEEHKHSNDNRYNRVILHIVLNDDAKVSHDFEILRLDPEELQAQKTETTKENDDIADILEDLQQYSLNRILRKTGEAQKLLYKNNVLDVLGILTREYLQKYHARRKRPVYTDEALVTLGNTICKSKAGKFVDELNDLEPLLIPDKMIELIKTPLGEEGAHLRREIVLNCVLPLALAISGEQSRINLLVWFWATPAMCSYGKLKRRFPALPQNFIWQQQGMLEYLRQYGNKEKIDKDNELSYGFSEILGFYYNGKMPFNK